ncbi:uncharacterized protein PG998_008778 [Apiospora kogelbergensis]|uniref:uncharacterized protein n=1 Tax=Apiospora kogelbergensis TaxID=1337665 RepID=UPI00312DDF42
MQQGGSAGLAKKVSKVCSEVQIGLQDLQVSLSPRTATWGPIVFTCSKDSEADAASLASRLRIRRIKCDEARPSCLKCTSTGRKCDGYDENPLTSPTAEGSEAPSKKPNKPESPCTTVSAAQPQQGQAKCRGPALQNLGPLMVLPVAGSAQADNLCFFEHISIKQLNEYQTSESWRNTLMLFSQTVPAVRHAAMAVGLIYRSYLDHDTRDSHQTQPWQPNSTAFLHYNRAIQLLLNQQTNDSIETTAITLLVCYLFTCFEHLAGNEVQAITHLRGGVKLSQKMGLATLGNNDNECDNASPIGVGTLLGQVTRQIRRLDMQAVMFLRHWTPVEMQEKLVCQLPTYDAAFQSLEQAIDHFQPLIAQVMILRNMEHQMFPAAIRTPGPARSLKDAVLHQMNTWSSLFENMLLLQQDQPRAKSSEAHRVIYLLRLQYISGRVFLLSYGSRREMDYDDFLPQFRQCVVLARDVAAAHERFSGSPVPTFTPEIGFVPTLNLIGVKCRHPVVRREALSILRRQRTQESVWDSFAAARVLERVIELEEGGLVNGPRAQGMGQIPVWQRVETMTWKNLVKGQGQLPARVEIKYRFCTREELHSETLAL